MSELLFEVAREAYYNRSELNNGLRDKKISKSDWCQVCGERSTLESHHARYGKDCGLKVVWCCPLCHVIVDGRRRGREKMEGLFNWDEMSHAC